MMNILKKRATKVALCSLYFLLKVIQLLFSF
jgi:hypothetical protein